MTVAGRSLELAHPVSVDDLLDEDDYNRHQRLPYWGTLWPSARMLAARIADAEGRGRRLLELGCGVGLVSLSASLAGFDVLATDYYADALEFVAANAQHNGLTGIATRCVDWRQYPSDLVGFDLIVGLRRPLRTPERRARGAPPSPTRSRPTGWRWSPTRAARWPGPLPTSAASGGWSASASIWSRSSTVNRLDRRTVRNRLATLSPPAHAGKSPRA